MAGLLAFIGLAAELAFRAMGVIYVIGAVALFRQLWFGARLEKWTRAVERASAQLEPEMARLAGVDEPPPDRWRAWWWGTGGALTAASGIAMALLHPLAVPLLAALVVHQMLYFVRQRRRELKARSPRHAENERPTTATRNGFYVASFVALLGAWLSMMGRLG